MAAPATSPAPGLVPVCLRAPSGRTAIYYLPPGHAAALRGGAKPGEAPEEAVEIHEELEDARPETPQWPGVEDEEPNEPAATEAAQALPQALEPQQAAAWSMAGPWQTEAQRQVDYEQQVQLQMLQQMRMQSLHGYQSHPLPGQHQSHQHQPSNFEAAYEPQPALSDDEPPKNFALQALTEALDRAEVQMLTGGRSRASDDVSDAMRQCGIEVDEFSMGDNNKSSTNFALKAAGEALSRALDVRPKGPKSEDLDQSLATALGLKVNPAGRRKAQRLPEEDRYPAALPSRLARTPSATQEVTSDGMALPQDVESRFDHLRADPFQAQETLAQDGYPFRQPLLTPPVLSVNLDLQEKSRALIRDLEQDDIVTEEAKSEMEEWAEDADGFGCLADALGLEVATPPWARRNRSDPPPAAQAAAPSPEEPRQQEPRVAPRELPPPPRPVSSEVPAVPVAQSMACFSARTTEDWRTSELEPMPTSQLYIIPGVDPRKLTSMSRDFQPGRIRMPRSNSRPKVPPIERRPLQKRDNLVDFVLTDVDPARATTPRLSRGPSMKGQAMSTCYSHFPDRKQQLTPRRSTKAQPTVPALPPLAKKKRYMWP